MKLTMLRALLILFLGIGMIGFTACGEEGKKDDTEQNDDGKAENGEEGKDEANAGDGDNEAKTVNTTAKYLCPMYPGDCPDGFGDEPGNCPSCDMPMQKNPNYVAKADETDNHEGHDHSGHDHEGHSH